MTSKKIAVVLPTEIDILCGRGRTYFAHGGNKRFRGIVGKHLQAYLTASSKSKKALVIQRILDEILIDGVRFLTSIKRAPGGAAVEWFIAGKQVARNKVRLLGTFSHYFSKLFAILIMLLCQQVAHALRDAIGDKSRAIKQISIDTLALQKARTALKEENETTLTPSEEGTHPMFPPDVLQMTVTQAGRISFLQQVSEEMRRDPARPTTLKKAAAGGSQRISSSSSSRRQGARNISAMFVRQEPIGNTPNQVYSNGGGGRRNPRKPPSGWSSCAESEFDRIADLLNEADILAPPPSHNDEQLFQGVCHSLSNPELWRSHQPSSSRCWNSSMAERVVVSLDTLDDIEIDDLDAYLSCELSSQVLVQIV